MAKETYWFRHDFEPTSDPKISALLSEYGAAGYGYYWRIIEMLHSNEEHKLPLKKYLFIAIAKQMEANAEQIEAFVKSCIDDYELLKSDGEMIWSNRVNKNISERKSISDKRSASGSLGAIAKQTLANAKQNLAIKEKESKVKEIKEKKNKELIAPTADEVQNYFSEKGYTKESGLKAFHYYQDADWKDSRGKNVLNWKQKMQGNWFKEENRENQKTNRDSKVLEPRHFYTDAQYLDYCKENNLTPTI